MEHANNDFKWFGEGFDGFPKRLPEDCVQYTLYILNAELNGNELLARLEHVMSAALKLTDSLLGGYIWQREKFMLEISQIDELKLLTGCTNYGDSVEDEWFIVYILRELSKLYPELWIEIVDTDGQFLLIEAANTLPRWLNPEIADHRVWIHEGNILIIPLTQKSTFPGTKISPTPKPLTLKEAHEFIVCSSAMLTHSPLIEAEAFYRLRNYPARIAESQHHTLITIPRRLAYVLHLKPELISPAVESFYIRDSIALRPLQINYPNSEGRVLLFPPEDFVTVSVQFTKVGFAQVRGQHFVPPTAWAGSLPTEAGAKELSAAETGMKVSCGFEMLAGDPQNKSKSSVVEIRQLLISVDNANEKLPSDEEIAKWEKKDDDESWLNINFEDFDDELSGRKAEQRNEGKKRPGGGFGDSAAHGDLQKIVERFEAFLNDNEAGADGADAVGDIDISNHDSDNGDEDEDDDESCDDEEEDKDVSFDENEFARMMREMMGMPPVDDGRLDPPGYSTTKGKEASRTEKPKPNREDEDEEEALRQVMQRMELELNEAGVLDLDPTPKKIAATRIPKSSIRKGTVGTTATREEGDDHSVESSSDEEVDIDFNLAKNLLESFKSQAGMAGPSGNLLGMLGMQLPRDEDGGED
ncbi:hypothetical protein FGG08_001764 [Glutinoglossum americanum]|uniref:Ecdysoneless n=1 Tax=Glutinoglossum americanum TaxID=1670608 RepID=A0A9P8I1I4_9PEZI|nr:hypothetical protein FGG08_001764 [Glutinoglossum americanum]